MPKNALRPGEDRLRPLWDPGDLDASAKNFLAALDNEKAAPGRAEVITQLARVELKRGRPGDARRLLDDAAKLAADTPVVRARLLLERGRIERRFGDLQKAKQLLEQAVDAALAADEPFIAADAAHARALAGDIVEWTNRGLELADRYRAAAYWRGTLLINLGAWHWDHDDPAAALTCFEDAVAIRAHDGRNPAQLDYARYGVARSLRRLGRAAEAVPILEQAVHGAIASGDDASVDQFRRELAASRAEAAEL
jgi:tetratricopeptide (TPR) repeat protein